MPSPFCFPVYKQKLVVLGLADRLAVVHGTEAGKLWRAEAWRIGDGLLVLGIEPAEISRQIVDRLDAVRSELERRGIRRKLNGEHVA